MAKILDRINDAVFAVDEEFRFTYLNKQAENLLDADDEKLLGKRFWDAYPGAEESEICEVFQEALESQQSIKTELSYEPLDLWVSARVYPSETGLSVYFGDISERKEHERELDFRRALLEAQADSTIDGQLVVDQNRSIVYYNQRFAEIWEIPEEILEERSDEQALNYILDNLADPNEFLTKVEYLYENPEEESRDEIKLSDGRWIDRYSTPVIGETGTHYGRLWLFRDITDRKEYERRLEESNERLKQFAYAASHDLQEPLRMVSSYLQLVEQRYADDLDEDGREFIEFAVDGADRMRNMIEELLEYSRVETQGEPLEPVDLETVFEEACQDLEVKIEESDAVITAESLPSVRGDPAQLSQVFQNLLGNSIKYSGDEPPEIHVSAERNGDEWIIAIRDEGIGINSDDTDRVFDVFESLHADKDTSGTGIGLALCQRIIERHGGEIWVDSEPGEGSTFFFSLPQTRE